MPSRFAALSRDQLSTLVPELLLIGHLIDRSGMAYALGEWGPDEMTKIAIDEWMACSPIYTRRMQRTLQFEGDDVVTIFKGIQLEIGAPPQFLDFRFWVEEGNPYRGGFHLDHCGALLDVEPMGEVMVKNMCHDIEDPTFDATAVATNPKAQVRPVHRPPRSPAGRTPHCAWTVTIDPSHPDVQPHPDLAVIARKRVATLELDPIDVTESGATDYSGDLVSDIDFAGFAHSALVRLADEVCIQQHLLFLSFAHAVRNRAKDDEQQLLRVIRNQLIGHAGLAAERLTKALGLSPTPEDAVRLLELHPVMNPVPYVDFRRDGATITVRPSAAHEDGAWLSLIDPEHPEALQAIVRGLSPYLDVEINGDATSWTAQVVERDTPAPEAEPVQITKFSGGATFQFEPRTTLPLFVV
ncbi:MAG TPA: hypothetical protein VFK52_11165 [Nocardioidaceae bacterium]|nr:hypothetical protein [Nocardioidaceae bacterium]